MGDEENLPIDINFNKMADWLVDRQWVKKGFQKDMAHVRKLITEAMKDMPDVEAITKLVSRSYINYFHCKQIVELLKVARLPAPLPWRTCTIPLHHSPCC